jgi:ribosomal protein L17
MAKAQIMVGMNIKGYSKIIYLKDLENINQKIITFAMKDNFQKEHLLFRQINLDYLLAKILRMVNKSFKEKRAYFCIRNQYSISFKHNHLIYM